jgi:hypothetical protein
VERSGAGDWEVESRKSKVQSPKSVVESGKKDEKSARGRGKYPEFGGWSESVYRKSGSRCARTKARREIGGNSAIRAQSVRLEKLALLRNFARLLKFARK